MYCLDFLDTRFLSTRGFLVSRLYQNQILNTLKMTEARIFIWRNVVEPQRAGMTRYSVVVTYVIQLKSWSAGLGREQRQNWRMKGIIHFSIQAPVGDAMRLRNCIDFWVDLFSYGSITGTSPTTIVLRNKATYGRASS